MERVTDKGILRRLTCQQGEHSRGERGTDDAEEGVRRNGRGQFLPVRGNGAGA